MDATLTEAPAVPKQRLLLYDGVCGVCNTFVQTMLDLDREGVFTYAPLQGETVAELRERHPEIPEGLDTIVYIEDGRVYAFSGAVLRAARHLPWPWKAGAAFLAVPWPIRDVVYRTIANNRYRWFGTVDSCRIPRPGEIERFLP